VLSNESQAIPAIQVLPKKSHLGRRLKLWVIESLAANRYLAAFPFLPKLGRNYLAHNIDLRKKRNPRRTPGFSRPPALLAAPGDTELSKLASPPIGSGYGAELHPATLLPPDLVHKPKCKLASPPGRPVPQSLALAKSYAMKYTLSNI